MSRTFQHLARAMVRSLAPIRARTWASRLLLSIVMIAGTLAVTASVASAAPTACTTVNGGNFAESLCMDGTGQHRVVMVQRHFLYPDVPDLRCEGPWVSVGLTSQIDCGFQQVLAVTVQTMEDRIVVPGVPDMMARIPPTTISPRIRIPKPAGLATPVPVDCFRQKFEDLIVRTSDNRPAYAFVVNVMFCVNRVANFAVVTSFDGDARVVGQRIPEIVSLQNASGTTRPAPGGQIALADQIKVEACRDPSTRTGCQSFVHNFSGTVSAPSTTGNFEFNAVL
ncbi:hypothetical protein DMH04_26745 [Kibdelosporangium aridum]|uniref:Uncharacterized protein n=1 Tax=Kibdelosporangium aridum TaxID=2030 RepID=A0A428Z543_KIBAR|nr:hypothetical protein [Kibdelosporangium aridum]RSM81947.1 hypothetical protein DMH04_26745 [Kibdelosporangium aridum]